MLPKTSTITGLKTTHTVQPGNDKLTQGKAPKGRTGKVQTEIVSGKDLFTRDISKEVTLKFSNYKDARDLFKALDDYGYNRLREGESDSDKKEFKKRTVIRKKCDKVKPYVKKIDLSDIDRSKLNGPANGIFLAISEKFPEAKSLVIGNIGGTLPLFSAHLQQFEHIKFGHLYGTQHQSISFTYWHKEALPNLKRLEVGNIVGWHCHLSLPHMPNLESLKFGQLMCDGEKLTFAEKDFKKLEEFSCELSERNDDEALAKKVADLKEIVEQNEMGALLRMVFPKS